MYPLERTALVVIDATNDFISENGKAWPMLREVCEEVGTVSRARDFGREEADVSCSRSANACRQPMPSRWSSPGPGIASATAEESG
ncbi:hypothetical protein Misp01_66260 [Microtetraspora sp. NBRC 13810]|nr:hypothetical protein Misp01_66260 [Microtetraspora sp. NBRC 13810]